MACLTEAFLVSALKSVIAVIAVFVVSIVIHEFGHFIVAKRSGVAVPAFAVGFGPKLWKRRWHGTEYSIRLFPIGGLVQLAGEVPQDALFRKGEKIAFRLNDGGEITAVGEPNDLPDGIEGTLRDLNLLDKLQMTIETEEGTQTYPLVPHADLMTSTRSSIPIVEKHEQVLGKPIWQRAAIILAGPFMNFVLAAVLFGALYIHTGVPVNSPVLGQIVPNSAAAAAGLKQGDRIVSVDGKPMVTWLDLVTEIQSDTQAQPLHLTILRDSQTINVTVAPHLTKGVPILGVNQPVSYNGAKAVWGGVTSVYYGSVNALHLYGQVFAHPQQQMNNLAGPVGIADVIGQQAQMGIWHVVMIAGLLSMNLGLFNLLPIPALDGGRLLFMLVELVRGRAVDPRKEGFVHFVGFALLMLFAVFITYRDVTRLF